MWPCLLITSFFDIKGVKILTWVVNIYVARLAEQCTIIPYTECV